MLFRKVGISAVTWVPATIKLISTLAPLRTRLYEYLIHPVLLTILQQTQQVSLLRMLPCWDTNADDAWFLRHIQVTS